MEHLLDHFPVFEANQVLMSGHLNDVFDYLDHQTRQSRSHLVGIGIVCGLEIALDADEKAIVLSKGCGVTSEGYLIVEPEDVSLVAYRDYKLPPDLEYEALAGVTLWELFEDGEPETTALDSPAGFLDDKAVLLFFEMKKESLRNCSPNNCDDKGSQVVATVRRLLIGTDDLDKVIAAANELADGLAAADIADALSAKLALPDLRLRRFDVVNTAPATSADVYAAFLKTFRTDGVAKKTGEALAAAYQAFKPLVGDAYPANPFGEFDSAYGFLDGAPANAEQVRFLQYYVDLFDDILRAYDEFRWKAAELTCACCPPAGLFARHLMLGDLHGPADTPQAHRQPFIPSPAMCGCAQTAEELVKLFSRLVEMTLRFTNAPSLPGPDPKAIIDPQIRVTPSRRGNHELGKRALPYYYEQTGTPPLFRLWDPEKTRRNRANQNLGYRAGEFVPAAPAFVTDALSHDLEPYDFFRVEGHLGKPYEGVMQSLLTLKTRYRLPLDVIALRTGPYDDNQPVDLSQESARFQDLEALFDALREELLAALAEGTREIYEIGVPKSSLPGGTPKNALLKSHAPGFRYKSGTIGAWYEQNLNRFLSMPYVDIDQTNIDANAVLTVYCALFTGTTGLANDQFPHAVSLYYFMKLAEILPGSLDALAYGDFENKCQDLLGLVRYFRTEAAGQVTDDLKAFLPQDELMDLCEGVLFNCQLDPIRSVHQEYVRRIGELKKWQFLVTFLKQHPGIQHKAGVPSGGTFVLVYHGNPSKTSGKDAAFDGGGLSAVFDRRAVGNFTLAAGPSGRRDLAGARNLATAIERIRGDRFMVRNADVNAVIAALSAAVPEISDVTTLTGLDDETAKIIAATVADLPPGTIIADFYLPYRLCGSGPAAQYVLPRPTPSFVAGIGCTNPDKLAAVEVIAKGGTSPYDIAVDEQGYQTLSGPLMLASGVHVLIVRDADGTESAPQTITVPLPIQLTEPKYKCSDGKFTATFAIGGGVPPYSVNGTGISGNQFTTEPADSETAVAVEVKDSSGCAAQAQFTHKCPPACNLPCAGAALRRGYRFWIPDPDPEVPHKSYALGEVSFKVESKPGNFVDLSAKVAPVIRATASGLKPENFAKTVGKWISQINEIIADTPELNEAGQAQWLSLAFEAGGPGRFGTLWIEHFDCLGFELRFRSNLSTGGFERQIEIGYTREDNPVIIDDSKAKSPPFEGEMFDKCDPDEKPTPFCPEPPAFDLRVRSVASQGLTVTAEVVPVPNTANLTFVWEVRAGQPAIGNGKRFASTFKAAGDHEFVVTAYTAKGCKVAVATKINVG